ncbi:MAG: aminotransferase class IV [Candidatus Aenigmarchaeota archaeon]|nr:aminotransferase class IV [Candidatus Aenigmarchaeota archaeon]
MEWDKDAIIILDGKPMRQYEAKTSIGDPGLAYGHVAFDTIKAVPDKDGGRYFAFREGGTLDFVDERHLQNFAHTLWNDDFEYGHLDRLQFSVSTMRAIRKLPVSKMELKQEFEELVQENAGEYKNRTGELPTFYARIQVWQGNTDMSKPDQIGVANDAPARYAILLTRYTSYLAHDKSQSRKPTGVMIVDKPRLLPPECMDPQAKRSPRYGIAADATHLAREHRYDEALLKDMKGNIGGLDIGAEILGEGGGENIICYKNGVFYIPRSDSALNGFNQHAFMLCVRWMGGEVKREIISPSNLMGMEYIWLTGTAAGEERVFRVGNETGKEIWKSRHTPETYDSQANEDVLHAERDFDDLVSGRKELSGKESSLITVIKLL